MARKRPAKKRSSSKRKQGRRNSNEGSSTDDNFANNNEESTLRSATTTNSGSSSMQTGKTVTDTTSQSTSPSSAVALTSPPPNSLLGSPTPGKPFFSPPAADLNSLHTPQPRPIHTPYSSRRRLGSEDSESTGTGASTPRFPRSPAAGFSPASFLVASPSSLVSRGGASSVSSGGASPRGALAEQVRDLNHLLTSPLVVHLGDLVDTDPTHDSVALGQMTDDEDDMSEEWTHLAQSESLLREELEALQDTPAALQQQQTPSTNDPTNNSNSSSIPPAIARQRLDPMASPLHPYALFPGGAEEEKKESSPTNLVSPSAKSPGRSYLNKHYETSEQNAAHVQARLAAGSMDSLDESMLSGMGSIGASVQQTNPRPRLPVPKVVGKVKSLAQKWQSTAKSPVLHCTSTSANTSVSGLELLSPNTTTGSQEAIVSPSPKKRSSHNDSPTTTSPRVFSLARGSSSVASGSTGPKQHYPSLLDNCRSSSTNSGDSGPGEIVMARGAQPLPKEEEAQTNNGGVALQCVAPLNKSTSSSDDKFGPQPLETGQQDLPLSPTSCDVLTDVNSPVVKSMLKGMGRDVPLVIHADQRITAAYAVARSVGQGNMNDCPIPRVIEAPRVMAKEHDTPKWKGLAEQHLERQGSSHSKKSASSPRLETSVDAALQRAVALNGSSESEDDHNIVKERWGTTSKPQPKAYDKYMTPSLRDNYKRSNSQRSGSLTTPMVGSVQQQSTGSNKSTGLSKFFTPIVSSHRPPPSIDTNIDSDTGYHTALQSRDGHEDKADHLNRTELGTELDQLVHSLPQFSPAEILDDLASTPRSRTVSVDRSIQSGNDLSVDPEISRLVNAVQEQLDQSSTLTADTPITFEQLEHQMSSFSSLDPTHTSKRNGSPALSEGILQVKTGDSEEEMEESFKGAATLRTRFMIDTIESVDFTHETDEDDDMGYELDQLESSEYLLRQALQDSIDGYSLPSKATTKTPPEFTNQVICDFKEKLKPLASPLPFASPATDSGVTSPNALCPPMKRPPSMARGDKDDEDLDYYHERDPEPQIALSPVHDGDSSSSSSSSSMSDEAMTGSVIAVGTMSVDGTISTIAHGASSVSRAPTRTVLQQGSFSPAANLSLEEKLKHLSPVMSIATSTSTPRRCGARGSTPMNTQSSLCALNHLVRTPSDESTEGGESGSQLPYQFVEDSDTSSEPSPTMAPLAPDERPFREQIKITRFNARSSDAELRESIRVALLRRKGSPKENHNTKELIWGESTQQELEDACMHSEYHQSRERDFFANWHSRLKQTNHMRFEKKLRELQERKGQFVDMDDFSIQSTPELADMSTSLQELRIGVHTPPRKPYRQGVVSAESSPVSVKSADHAWMSKSSDRRRNRSLKSLHSAKLNPRSSQHRKSLGGTTPPKAYRSRSPRSPDLDSEGRNEATNLCLLESDDDESKTKVTCVSKFCAFAKSYTPRTTKRQRLDSEDRNEAADLDLETELFETDGEPKARQNCATMFFACARSFALCTATSSDSNGNKAADLDLETGSQKSFESDGEHNRKEACASKFCACARNYSFCMVICLAWCLFLGLIVSLGVMFFRSENDTAAMESIAAETPLANVSTVATSPQPTIGLVTSPMVSPTLAPIIGTIAASLPPGDPYEPTLSPVAPHTANASAFATKSPTSAPTARRFVPDPQPTLLPNSGHPTLSPTVSDATLNLISLIVSRSVDKGAALLDRTSPEYASLSWLTTNIYLESYSDQQKIQRFVLGVIYYAMNGDEWTENDRWLTDWDECKWFSKSRRQPVCNKRGELEDLSLGYLDVSGTLPKALGMLSNSLERIDIEGGPTAFITGTIPTQFGHLTLMRDLRLGENLLSGEVPDELQRWRHLETLDLSGNSFRGSLPLNHPNWLALRQVDLGENYFVGTISKSIGKLMWMQKLLLHDNLLDGAIPSEIGLLTNLQDIYLDQNILSSFPSEIGNLHRLESLMMAANNFRNNLPSEIGQLSQLRTLSLTFNSLKGEIPTEIGLLVHLRDRIDLSYNELTGEIPSEIGSLTKMKHLLLQANKLTGSLPADISALHRLNTLRIDSNDMTGRVDDPVCDVFNETLPYFYADCTEIDCPCCIFCCEDGEGCGCRYENTVNQYLCF